MQKPSQYKAILDALNDAGIRTAESGWTPRPEGNHCVIRIDMEAGSLTGDGRKLDRVWEGSLDLFCHTIAEQDPLIEAVEDILTEAVGASWELNSNTYEQETRLFHMEWTFQCLDDGDES